MKAVTIWQPWASLVACGLKKYETRSWNTSYRGPLLIHAAKRPPRRDDWGDNGDEIVKALHSIGIETTEGMPVGCALCTVYLVNVFSVEDAITNGLISDQEKAFGDYSPGRYAWVLVNLVKLPEPIPMKGERRLWTPPNNF